MTRARRVAGKVTIFTTDEGQRQVEVTLWDRLFPYGDEGPPGDDRRPARPGVRCHGTGHIPANSTLAFVVDVLGAG